ncbi:MAG TPA: ABC transporter ATP-binding protein [Stellaceae bacterium]|jgi:ABC-2 type transport system ATP-binding protein
MAAGVEAHAGCRSLVRLSSVAAAVGAVPILRNVTLHLQRGEILGLLGPNGAGKTTTLSVVLGLTAPSTGTVRVLGLDPASHGVQVRALTGALPERGGFYGWMTAPDYLAFFARLYGVERHPGEIADRLAQVGLAPQPAQRIETFSHGMRQRLGLARALLADPPLILLDEPTSGLDPRGRHEVHDLLRSLARNGTGILLSTHLLDDVERLCDRITVISAGATVAEGTVHELAANAPDDAAPPQNADRYRLRLGGRGEALPLPAGVAMVGRDGEWCTVEVARSDDPSTIWRELMFLGWRVREIRQVENGGSELERLYLRLTGETDAVRSTVAV